MVRSAKMIADMRKYLRYISGKLLPKDWPYPILRGPLRGTRFILGAGAGAGGGASVYFNLVEPVQTKAFCEMVHRGNTVFDIGANVGYYTLLASRLVGDKGLVVAFEPAVRNLSYLYRHVSLNCATNVMIVPAACAATCFLAAFGFATVFCTLFFCIAFSRSLSSMFNFVIMTFDGSIGTTTS